MNHIGPRPWLIDDVESWVHRLRGPPHKECFLYKLNSFSSDQNSSTIVIFLLSSNKESLQEFSPLTIFRKNLQKYRNFMIINIKREPEN